MVTILLEKDSVGRNFIDSVLVRCSIFHGVCCVRTLKLHSLSVWPCFPCIWGLPGRGDHGVNGGRFSPGRSPALTLGISLPLKRHLHCPESQDRKWR